MEKYAAMKARDYALIVLGYLSAAVVAWLVTDQVKNSLIGGAVVAVAIAGTEYRNLRLRRNAADLLAHQGPS